MRALATVSLVLLALLVSAVHGKSWLKKKWDQIREDVGLRQERTLVPEEVFELGDPVYELGACGRVNVPASEPDCEGNMTRAGAAPIDAEAACALDGTSARTERSDFVAVGENSHTASVFEAEVLADGTRLARWCAATSTVAFKSETRYTMVKKRKFLGINLGKSESPAGSRPSLSAEQVQLVKAALVKKAQEAMAEAASATSTTPGA